MLFIPLFLRSRQRKNKKVKTCETPSEVCNEQTTSLVPIKQEIAPIFPVQKESPCKLADENESDVGVGNSPSLSSSISIFVKKEESFTDTEDCESVETKVDLVDYDSEKSLDWNLTKSSYLRSRLCDCKDCYISNVQVAREYFCNETDKSDVSKMANDSGDYQKCDKQVGTGPMLCEPSGDLTHQTSETQEIFKHPIIIKYSDCIPNRFMNIPIYSPLQGRNGIVDPFYWPSNNGEDFTHEEEIEGEREIEGHEKGSKKEPEDVGEREAGDQSSEPDNVLNVTYTKDNFTTEPTWEGYNEAVKVTERRISRTSRCSTEITNKHYLQATQASQMKTKEVTPNKCVRLLHKKGEIEEKSAVTGIKLNKAFAMRRAMLKQQ